MEDKKERKKADGGENRRSNTVEFLLDKTQPVVSSDDAWDFSGVVEEDKVYQVYWTGDDARTEGSFYDAKVLYMAVEFLLDKTQPVVSSDDVRDFSGVVEEDKVYQVYWTGDDARTEGSFYDAKILYMAVEFLLDKTQPVVSSDDVRDFSGVVEEDKVYQVYWTGDDARTEGSFYDAKILYMAAHPGTPWLTVLSPSGLRTHGERRWTESGARRHFTAERRRTSATADKTQRGGGDDGTQSAGNESRTVTARKRPESTFVEIRHENQQVCLGAFKAAMQHTRHPVHPDTSRPHAIETPNF
ncbi:hypothetical protein ISCGN_003978 [Ixodes scapularis]